MAPRSDFVSRIVELADPRSEIYWSLDWRRIESSLGHALPSDYKKMCEVLPPGKFNRFLWLLHPIGSKGASLLGRSPELIEVVEEFMEDEEECPGEPGRVYPCLVTDNGDVGYWIADSSKPDEWKIAINEGRGPEWDATEFSLSEFLYRFLTRDYLPGVFPASVQEGEPLFSSNF